MPHHVRRQLSEDAVIQAAEMLFVSKGYHCTTVDDIARKAGLTKGAVYFHFQDKKNVLAALLKRAAERVHDPIVARLYEPGDDSMGKIVHFLNGWSLAAVEQRNTMFLPILTSFEFLGTGDQVEQQLDAMYKRMYAAVIHVLEQGRRTGQIRVDNPIEEQAALIVSVVDGMLLEWLRRAPRLNGPEFMRTARKVVLSGLAVPSASAQPRRRPASHD